jgi:hypothetical protein
VKGGMRSLSFKPLDSAMEYLSAGWLAERVPCKLWIREDVYRVPGRLIAWGIAMWSRVLRAIPRAITRASFILSLVLASGLLAAGVIRSGHPHMARANSPG